MTDQDCEHVCKGPHNPYVLGGLILRCHNRCPSCARPIRYGCINEHLRECHKTLERPKYRLMAKGTEMHVPR